MYGTAYLSLSLLPLQSTHLKTDLINIRHYKNLNTIGKQNYQEPGVEAELNFEFFESFHLYSKQRYGHRSTSLTPITSAMLCYVMLVECLRCLLCGLLATSIVMDVNIVKLQSVVRQIILTILPRYPFVNAITLLLLLAERAVNEK